MVGYAEVVLKSKAIEATRLVAFVLPALVRPKVRWLLRPSQNARWQNAPACCLSKGALPTDVHAQKPMSCRFLRSVYQNMGLMHCSPDFGRVVGTASP